jgi:3-dehydroquinate synthase
MSHHTLQVELGLRAYPIHIGNFLLSNSALLKASATAQQVFIVSDENVAPLYLARVRNAFEGKTCSELIIPAGEQEKTLTRFTELMNAFANARANRDVTVYALGGGVIGDLTGFSAAAWMRGVRFVQLPTTLLAMVDSSVGGKTAVDLPQGKNLVGAFYQPNSVIIDVDTLRTLPAREISAGLAEVVKYGAIFDQNFFTWLENNADALMALNANVLIECIRRCCEFKAGVVRRDETEQGERMLLNFGHTFGHAIETLQGYGGLLHGEAVSVGMCVAANFSVEQGLSTAQDAARLKNLLKRFALPTDIPSGIDAQAMIERMRLDKKSLSGQLRLILLHGLGCAQVHSAIDEKKLADFLQKSVS